MTDKIQHHLIIPDTSATERLDQALAKLLPDYSRTQIQEWLAAGSILVNGAISKGKVKVYGGEEVVVDAVAKAQPVWEAEALPLNIVYEDAALLVINKPIGIVVHPGTGNQRHTLLNALLHHAPELHALPRAGILHRLDKDTSGLLVIAKTAKALKNLSHQLKKRTIHREYQAIVQGTMISGGTVDQPIARHPRERKRMAVCETGKEAITHYRVTERYRAHTLLQVRLETGRTHQIRVHMAFIRHPLVGDPTYGGRLQLAKGMSQALIDALRQFKHQALQASVLGFTHPIDQTPMRFEIDLPDDFQQLIHVLQKDKVDNHQ